MMADSTCCVSRCVVLSCVILGVLGKHTQQSYISAFCAHEITLEESVLLGLHNESQHLSPPYECDVVVKGTQLGYRLMVNIVSLHLISSPSCKKSKLILTNSDGTFITDKNGICVMTTASTVYNTTGQYMWIHFETNTTTSLEESFQIIVTSFQSELPNGSCPNATEMFKCSNGQCIARDLKCDGYDNCGDNSDEDHCVGLSTLDFTLIGLAAGVVLLFSVVLTICLLVKKVKRHHDYEVIIN